uniref:Uncharacterized protein n=1 Tax=Leersia perrieri TaxID=77586 RepID=A0A0D9V899_9ORYZ
MDDNSKLPWSEAERQCDIWRHRHRHSLALGRDRCPIIITLCYVSMKLSSAYGPAWRTAIGGGRSRRLRPLSRPCAVAQEACRAYRRQGEAGVNLSASLRAVAIDWVCGWSRRTVESVFRMADRQGKVSGLIRHTIDKRKDVVRWRRGVATYKQQRRMQVPMSRSGYHLLHEDSAFGGDDRSPVRSGLAQDGDSRERSSNPCTVAGSRRTLFLFLKTRFYHLNSSVQIPKPNSKNSNVERNNGDTEASNVTLNMHVFYKSTVTTPIQYEKGHY